MINWRVKLQTLEEMCEFVRKCNQIDGDVDLICGRITVDAKSLLGVISLDVKRILLLQSNTESVERAEQILQPYLVA